MRGHKGPRQGLEAVRQAGALICWSSLLVVQVHQAGRAGGLTAFGNYPALALMGAHTRRAEALALLAEGIDPV